MGNFLGSVARNAVGLAPYAEQAMDKVRQLGLQQDALARQKVQDAQAKALNDAKIASMGEEPVTYRPDENGNVIAMPKKLPKSVFDGGTPGSASGPASAPSSAPNAPQSFMGPSASEWQASLRGGSSASSVSPSPTPAPSFSQPAVQGTVPKPPQQGQPGQPPTQQPATGPKPMGVATGIKAPPPKPPAVSPYSQQAIAADSTKAANRTAIASAAANSPAAITADSTKKANAQAIKVANPLPTRAGAAPRIDPNSPAGITADSTKKANAAAIKAGGTSAGGANADKERIYVGLMDQSYPTMERLIDKVRPAAIAAAIHYPTAGNATLTQDEQTFLAASRDFLAGMLHAESGARLSKEQLAFGLQRILPNLGDTNGTLHVKLGSAKQTLATRKALFAAPAGGGRGTAAPTGTPAPTDPFADIPSRRPE